MARSSDKQENNDSDEDIDIADAKDKENDYAHELVTSCQEIHIRLGYIILPVVITIPKEGLSKFRENGNASYAELVNLINGKLPQILQCEKNRNNNKPKSKKHKAGRYQIIKGLTTKFACRMELNKADYCFLENTKSNRDADSKWAERKVSPLCLNVIAAPLNGYLPFAESGDVLISHLFQTDTSKTTDTKSKAKKKRDSKKKK